MIEVVFHGEFGVDNHAKDSHGVNPLRSSDKWLRVVKGHRGASSKDFVALSFRLLSSAHREMFPNSSLAVDICLEPTTKYVSSAYFIILLCSCMGRRPKATMTYEVGPMTEPWTILALINATCDIMSHSLVIWPRSAK